MRFTTRVPSDTFPALPEPGHRVLLYTEGNPRPKPVRVVAAQAVGAELVLDLEMPYTHVVAPGAELPRSRRIVTRVSHGPLRQPWWVRLAARLRAGLVPLVPRAVK